MTAVMERGFSDPVAVMARLEEIERDMAVRQNALERAALAWFRAKREREKEHAKQYLLIRADGQTVADAKAAADAETAFIGQAEEAEWEALKAVVRLLSDRASIGQSILRAQGRT